MKAKVEKCTPSKNGGFVVKLIALVQVSILGMVKESKQTFFIKLPNAVAVGTETDLNLAHFDVVERGFIIPEGAEAGKEIFLKWLQNKAQNVVVKQRIAAVRPEVALEDAAMEQM
jgi:hypothetical protein